jgi:hypothetical protein
VLAQESIAKRSFRWVRLIVMSLPLTFVLAGFPAIIVWLLPRRGPHAYWAGIVAQVTAVMILLILGIVSARSSTCLTWIFRRSPFLWPTSGTSS